jgi:hypothetical protein
MDAKSLIACWELGRRRHPLDRALLLYAAAEPEADLDTLADRTIGERNAALLGLRSSLFGDALRSCVDCPECAERLEFELSADALMAGAHHDPSPASHVDVGGRRARLPTTRDLAWIADEADESSAARKLLGHLLVANASGTHVPADELANALEAADSRMDFSLELSCPACAHRWIASLDVPAFLWQELDVRARRLLDEVHALAGAYGWSEREILALGDARRQAYLDRVLA